MVLSTEQKAALVAVSEGRFTLVDVKDKLGDTMWDFTRLDAEVTLVDFTKVVLSCRVSFDNGQGCFRFSPNTTPPPFVPHGDAAAELEALKNNRPQRVFTPRHGRILQWVLWCREVDLAHAAAKVHAEDLAEISLKAYNTLPCDSRWESPHGGDRHLVLNVEPLGSFTLFLPPQDISRARLEIRAYGYDAVRLFQALAGLKGEAGK